VPREKKQEGKYVHKCALKRQPPVITRKNQTNKNTEKITPDQKIPHQRRAKQGNCIA
jgi:hypothetical protein